MPAATSQSTVLEPCVDQTLVAKLPELGDHSHDADGDHIHVDPATIPASLEKDDKAVKFLLRSLEVGVFREERRGFWNGLYERREGAEGVAANRGLYGETLKTCFGNEIPNIPSPVPSQFQTSHTPAHCLTTAGKTSVSRILTCVAYNNPDVQYCPVAYSLAAALRHYMTEEDTYGFVTCLMSCRSPKFVSQSKLQSEVDWRTVLELNKEYNKKIVTQMENETSSEEVEQLFQGWHWWIFDAIPFTHLSRLLDCYLFEGQKVLFRAALSLVRHFSKQQRANGRSTTLKKGKLRETFQEYLRNIAFTPAAIAHRAFKFRGLSRATILKLSLRLEIDLKAKGFVAKNGVGRSQSSDQLPSPDAVKAISAVSETLTYKQGMSTPQPKQKAMAASFPIHQLKSELLSKEGLTTLWHWLPERMTSIDPTLAYSSDEHGISLNTFYNRTEQYEPTILVIKTTNQELFGAYLTTSWGERKLKDDKGLRQAYFGTGECYLFKLGDRDGASSVKYPWVGLKQQLHDDGSGNVGDKELSKAEAHARELFMSGQVDMISIGGGDGNGIYIDSTLTHGKTERCLTFDNEPLCKGSDFQIAVIEVYGLNRLDW